MGAAFVGRDEARTKLRARVADPQRSDESALVADPTGAHDRNAEVLDLLVEPLGAVRSRVPARAIVHGNEAVHAAGQSLLGPFALGHVVINDAALQSDAVHHPARIA